MKRESVTVVILKQIRDEIRELRVDTNARFVEVNSRIDQTNEGLDALGRHVVGVEVRLGTEILGLRGDLSNVIDLLRGQLDLRPRVERCEQDIASLKEQVGRSG